MIPREAIERAFEEGWRGRYPSLRWKHHPDGIQYLAQESIIVVEWYAIALDPTFWQALGKALGWSEYGKHMMKGNNLRCSACGEKPHVIEKCRKNLVQVWKFNAIEFYDLILTGGNTSKFWSDLLTNPR